MSLKCYYVGMNRSVVQKSRSAYKNEQTKIVNFSPHAIAMYVEDEKSGSIEGYLTLGLIKRKVLLRKIAEYPSSGVARASVSIGTAGVLYSAHSTVPLINIVYEGIHDLPDPQEGVRYFVSVLTAEAAKRSGRVTNDLLVPGELARDKEGQILGMVSFGLFDAI